MAILTLISSDNVEFIVDFNVIKCSDVIAHMADCLGMDDPDDTTIPISTVSSPILRLVIDWATHHKDDPPPPPVMDGSNIDDPWDVEFLNKIDHTTLFQLLEAADFFSITGLLRLVCCKVKHLIKGKTRKEYIEFFGLPEPMQE